MPDIETSILVARNEIMELLKLETEKGGRIVGVHVFRGAITDGERIPTDEQGLMVPYIAVVFGGRGPVAQRQQGITNTRHDLRRFMFGIEAYARDENELDDLSDRVEDILEGREFTNTGPVTAGNSGTIQNPADVKQNHAREGRGLLFSCFTNTVTPNVPGAV